VTFHSPFRGPLGPRPVVRGGAIITLLCAAIGQRNAIRTVVVDLVEDERALDGRIVKCIALHFDVVGRDWTGACVVHGPGRGQQRGFFFFFLGYF
jgi:hypothetical protein